MTSDDSLRMHIGTYARITELIRRLNEGGEREDILRGLINLLREWSGCDAVGIRLHDGLDYPYFETTGFPAEFVLLENNLCTRDSAGNPLLDKNGQPRIECMCGNVIRGRYNPELPFFTDRGSFWSNSTTVLLAGTSEADRQSTTRNRCNGMGYESVALVPLRSDQTAYGLLQFNDKRPNRFTKEHVTFLECLADNIAIALSRMEEQTALRKSEERLRFALEGANDGLWDVTMKTNEVYISPRGCEILGYASSEMQRIASRWQDLVYEGDMAATQKKLQEYLEGLTDVFEVEQRLKTKSGALKWVLTRGKVAQFDVDGHPLRMTGTHTDITERKVIENKLLQSQRDLKAVLENMPSMIGYWDKDLRNRFANNAYLTWFGIHPDKMPGMHIKDVIGGERYRLNLPFIESALLGVPQTFERAIPNPDGTRVLHSLTHYIPDVINGEVHGFYALVTDVTFAKQAEDAMAISLKEKEIMLKEIHHRVKNNLQIISSLLSLQADGLCDPTVQDVLAESRGRVMSMALIHEQLYRSHDLSEIDVSDYLRQLLPRLVSTYKGGRDISLGLEFSPLA